MSSGCSQPNKPLFVAEFWTGWFAHWKEKKLERHLSAEEFEKALTIILKMNASVNLYMFHGKQLSVSFCSTMGIA